MFIKKNFKSIYSTEDKFRFKFGQKKEWIDDRRGEFGSDYDSLED